MGIFRCISLLSIHKIILAAIHSVAEAAVFWKTYHFWWNIHSVSIITISTFFKFPLFIIPLSFVAIHWIHLPSNPFLNDLFKEISSCWIIGVCSPNITVSVILTLCYVLSIFGVILKRVPNQYGWFIKHFSFSQLPSSTREPSASFIDPCAEWSTMIFSRLSTFSLFK